MKKLGIFVLVLAIILLLATVFTTWFLPAVKNNFANTAKVQTVGDIKQASEFVPLEKQAEPPFIKNISTAGDIKIGFHYDGDYKPEDTFTGEVPAFYTPAGSSENFLNVSKVKDRDTFEYGSNDSLPIFKSEESHSYQGTPIYITNTGEKYSLYYLGFKIDDKSLISELSVELGIDYNADYWDSATKSNDFSVASLLGVQTAYACGPGLYLRAVGNAKLNFIQESDGISWYKLEKPIALYNLNLDYCDEDCSTMPTYCKNQADDPQACDVYYCCAYDASIQGLQNGNLRMHVYYKANDKEGLLRIQMANFIVGDENGAYRQATMGEEFDHYYRAYLH